MLGISPLVSGLEHPGWREDTGRAAGGSGFAPSGAAECQRVNNWHSPAVVQDFEQPRDRRATRPLSWPDPEQPQGLCGRYHASAGSSQLLLPFLWLGFGYPGVRMGPPPQASLLLLERSLRHREASRATWLFPGKGPVGRAAGRRAGLQWACWCSMTCPLSIVVCALPAPPAPQGTESHTFHITGAQPEPGM